MSDDVSISAGSRIIASLALLDPERRRRAEAYAKAQRARLIREVVQDVRSALLPGWKDRAAARAIDDAARGRRAAFGKDPALRAQIENELKRRLGVLDDLPQAARIRQLLNKKQ
jgi:hypothetical protein